MTKFKKFSVSNIQKVGKFIERKRKKMTGIIFKFKETFFFSSDDNKEDKDR